VRREGSDGTSGLSSFSLFDGLGKLRRHEVVISQSPLVATGGLRAEERS